MEAGYDPPQSVVVLLDSELAEMEHTATPSVRAPRGFELLWRDEGDRADRALSIWRPVPFPGCVHIFTAASCRPDLSCDPSQIPSCAPCLFIWRPVPFPMFLSQFLHNQGFIRHIAEPDTLHYAWHPSREESKDGHILESESVSCHKRLHYGR